MFWRWNNVWETLIYVNDFYKFWDMILCTMRSGKKNDEEEKWKKYSEVVNLWFLNVFDDE